MVVRKVAIKGKDAVHRPNSGVRLVRDSQDLAGWQGSAWPKNGAAEQGNRPELSPQAGVRVDQNSCGDFDAQSSNKTVPSPCFLSALVLTNPRDESASEINVVPTYLPRPCALPNQNLGTSRGARY